MRKEIIIGLGGTGCRSVAEFRRILMHHPADGDHLQQKECMPEYLCIDASDDIFRCWEDAAEREPKNYYPHKWQQILLREGGEFPELSELSEDATLSPWTGDLERAVTEHLSWCTGDAAVIRNALRRSSGSAQMRRLGRALFALNAPKILSCITELLKEGDGNPIKAARFHLFCSLGGGTGSGCLLDMITLIQSLASHYGIESSVVVYGYAGGAKPACNDMGCFYENQYCTLRDLNALAVGAYSPYMNEMSRSMYTLPISRVYIASDLAPGEPSLNTQIQTLSLACFDSIVYGSCYTSPSALRAMEGSDLSDVVPGECGQNGQIKRSYRFAAVGQKMLSLPGCLQGRELAQCIAEELCAFLSAVPLSAAISPINGLKMPQISPAAAIFIGLPPGCANEELNELLRRTITEKSPVIARILPGRTDIYEHRTAGEVRFLYIPYWMPCRFTAVAEYSERKYRESVEHKQWAKLYLSNIDDSGIDSAPEFDRPTLLELQE